MQFEPITSRVLIKRDEHEEKPVSQIVITDDEKKDLTTGTVVAVGPGEWLDLPHLKTPTRRPMQVEVGMTVYFGPYAGTQIELDGVEYDVIWEREILGIVY